MRNRRIGRYAGSTRRTLSRLADRLGNGEFRSSTIPPPGTRKANWTEPVARGLAQTLLLIDQPRRAQRVLDRWHRRWQPSVDTAYLEATALLDGGPDQLVRAPTIGLTRAPGGDVDAAAAWFRIAIGLDRSRMDAQLGLARALHRRGEYDAALGLVRSASPTNRSKRVHAELIDLTGRARGAHLRSEVELMTELWESTLDETGDGSLRRRLVRHLVQIGDYAHALRVASAAPTGEQDREPVLFAQLAEATASGEIARAVALKRALARLVLARSALPAEPVSHVVERIQATSYLDGPLVALRSIPRRRLWNSIEQRTIQKLRADLHLIEGDVEHLRSYRSTESHYSPEAEARFVDLVANARVLVLGPGAVGRPTSDTWSNFDVVAVTKRRPSDVPSAMPCLVYPTDATARLDGYASDNPNDLFVLRPSIIAHHGAPIPVSPSVRLMTSEDSNTFLGTHFGVQRVLYDLLGRDAASISIAGLDFFLSQSTYIDGYTDEIARIFEPNDFQPNASIAPHDYVADFLFTQRLTQVGYVAAVPPVAQILSIDVDDYVERLQSVIRRPPESDGDNLSRRSVLEDGPEGHR